MAPQTKSELVIVLITALLNMLHYEAKTHISGLLCYHLYVKHQESVYAFWMIWHMKSRNGISNPLSGQLWLDLLGSYSA